MSRLRNIVISVTIILICLLLLFLNFNTKDHIKGKMKIGVSDDTSGFVINYMTEKNIFEGLEINDILDMYSVSDCWSSTTQWALSSEEMDMAIICKDAAKEYVKNDANFEIVGPLIKNSDIFLLGPKIPKSIGVTQKRDYQYDLVKKYYKDAEIVPLIGTALGYGLESNLVDAIVIDAMKSLTIKGDKRSTATQGEYESYVLVVNKDFKDTDSYAKFIRFYNEAVKDLENGKVFKKAIENYKGIDISNKEMEEIINWKVKFLQIEE